jgi:hypothetical protein
MKTNTNMYHTVGIIPKSNIKIQKNVAKLIPLTHKYMTAHFPGLLKVLQWGKNK